MPFSCFANASFAKVFILKFGKHIIAIFCLPIQVPEVYSNFMAVMCQFNIHKFHFRCLRATRGHTKSVLDFECAKNSMRTQFYVEKNRKNLLRQEGNSSTG